MCSQCVDRRFAALAAGLAAHDRCDGYKVDVFTDPLEEGNPRNLVLSYVRFALSVSQLSDDALFEQL